MYMPINPLGYSCIKKLQRDNLWHAYNEPINFYSVPNTNHTTERCKHAHVCTVEHKYLIRSLHKWEEEPLE